MELLAPAGNLDNFQAAIEAGADAVYVGAPGCNARNLAKDLSLEEIGAMIHFCHDHGKKLYLAANSLVLEKELPRVIETLALLESLQPDALIVQDLGLIHLIREHFPGIILHASTLMMAHNHDSVKILGALGCERVVLARELTLKEIADIASKTDLELEIFVHGAMCFSYSGLCLFSSFLGGKSGLRGRCVQPCRRRYSLPGKRGRTGTKKGGGGSYLFSMNDLSGIHAIPALAEAGVSSLKIEGRLRSAHYVSHIVRAYRELLDAEKNEFEGAVLRAEVLAKKAMGRKVSTGFFFTPQPKDAIIPYHSGNVGEHLGRIDKIGMEKNGLYGRVILKESVGVGDRLRLHYESSGNRKAFTLKKIFIKERLVEQAEVGEVVNVSLPGNDVQEHKGRVELYKVDVRDLPQTPLSRKLKIQETRKELKVARKNLDRSLKNIISNTTLTQKNKGQGGKKQSSPRPLSYRGQLKKKKQGRNTKKLPLEFWLKTDNLQNLHYKMPFTPDHFLLTMERRMITQASQVKRMLGRGSRKVIWALPSVLLEQDLKRVEKNIRTLIRTGFKSFQLGHLSQMELFGTERVHLYGDYTLNFMNNQALQLASQAGFSGLQLSIESDKESLHDIVMGYRAVQRGLRTVKGKASGKAPKIHKALLGLTVYGVPPLFTARLAADHFQYSKTLVSPKNESFTILKKEGVTQIVAKRPFSLLPYMQELKNIGLDYMIVDLTNMASGKKELQELEERLSGKGRFPKLPTFNYLGHLE